MRDLYRDCCLRYSQRKPASLFMSLYDGLVAVGRLGPHHKLALLPVNHILFIKTERAAFRYWLAGLKLVISINLNFFGPRFFILKHGYYPCFNIKKRA